MKKKIISLFLSLAISLSCLPIGIIASASESGATAQSGYNFKTQKKGIHFYSLGMPHNYDPDGNGTVTTAESLAELKVLLEEGYFNEIFCGAPSAELLELLRHYNCTFWYMPGRWNPSGESLGGYLSRINTTVNAIKTAGAWDLFNGFHWDEPLGSGMTNEQINQMTEYLAKTHKKRIYPVISSYLVSEANREISEAAGKNEKELLSPIALEYVTDIGWDTYTYDVRDIALNDPVQAAKLQKYSQVSGKNITTADELYRDTHATIMSMIDHPVNVWFYVAAYNAGPYTKLGAGEDFSKAQLEYFDKLLDETTAQYENQLAGGLAIFTYQSDKFTGLSKRLPITVNGTQLYPEEPYADKWEDFAATMKSIKAKYDKTTDNVIYTGEKAPLDTDVDDSAHYLHKVPRITTSENTKYFHYTSDQQALSLRHDTDGNFYVIDSSKLNTSGKYTELKVLSRKGIDSTIDASKVKAIAVRMKINDNSPAYSYNPASFELMLNSPNGDGKESDDFWKANVSRTDTYTPMWLDLNDGSYTKMYPSSGNSSAAYFHTIGSMNGYMIIPIEAFANSSTRMTTSNERFTELLDAIRVTFIHTPDSESPKASNWNDKEFLFGDCYLVEDVDTFVAKRTEGTVKYNSGHDDGAYLAQKIPAYKMYYGGGINSTLYVPQIIAKASNDPTLAQNDESGYLHITKLADGSRAIEIKPNSNERAFVIARNYDTYEGKNQTGYYKDAIGGVPSSITSLGINGLASRVQITGNEGKTVNLALAVTSGTAEHEYCYYKTNIEGSKIKFISADNGEITEYTVRNNGIEISGNINGYLVATDVSNASWSGLLSSSINNDVTGVGMVIYPGETNTDATIYLSDSYWLTDVEKFVNYHAIGISLNNVSVGKTSINIEKQDNAVYSLDGVTWDNGEGSFTELENRTTYTIYAKETTTGYVISKTFKTLSALDTERGDGSYYYYNVDTPAVGSTIALGQYTWVGTTKSCFGQSTYKGTYKDGAPLHVENINGDGMIRFDYNESYTAANNTTMLYFNYRSDTTPINIKDYVDTEPLTHLALRVKVSGGTKGQLSQFNISFFESGVTASDLSNIRLIDYKTRTVINPNWTKHFDFTDEFDGWIIIPFDAYATKTFTYNGESEVMTGKQQILGLTTKTPIAKKTIPSGIFVKFFFTTTEDVTDGYGWDNRVLNFGDVVVLEDVEKFMNLNTVGINLEKITTGKTTISVATQNNAVYSLDGASWDNGEGTFTGLTHNTTYTVYAKNTSNGAIISKEVKTLDVEITLDNVTTTNTSITVSAQPDAVYSLDGASWDNGEGVFENLKSNTTYIVYAKEVSSGIVISKEIKTDVSVITLDNVTVGKTTITVEQQYDAVYSLDGNTFDNGEGIFTGLNYNTTYTVYAKNLSNGEIISKEVKTLDVEITLDNVTTTNTSITVSAQPDAVYSLDGTSWDNGEGVFENLKSNTTYIVYAKEVSSGIVISKEIKTDVSVITLDNVTVGKTSITAKPQYDAVYSLDNESWDNGEGIFTGLNYNTTYTVYAKNLSNGEIISKEVKTLDVEITLDNVTTTNTSITVSAQPDAVYSLDGTSWDNGEGIFTGLNSNSAYTVYAKEVSSGIVISKEVKTDVSVITLDNVTVGKTTITVEQQYDAVYSLDGNTFDNGEGIFTGLNYNTTYTVYAKNLSNGEIISKEVKTLDVEITLENATVTNQSIIFPAQDDVVYSLDGIRWDNGEGSFTDLEINTVYTVYAKEVSSGIVISKEIKTLSSFGSNPIETPYDYLCIVFGHNFADATCTAPKTCKLCGETEGEVIDHTYNDVFDEDCNVCGFIREVDTFRFSGASLTLESNIAINFKANKGYLDSAGYTNPVATFYFSEGSRVTVEGVDNGNGQYVFTFKNIAPDRIGDVVTAKLSAQKDGETVTSETIVDYSVKDYCYNMLNKDSTSDVLKTLLVDLLNYGAASQIYTSTDLDNLANAGLTDEQKAFATTDVTINAAGSFIGEAKEIKWKSASLLLGDVVFLRFKFNAPSKKGLTVKVTTDDGDEWIIDKLEATGSGEWGAVFKGFNAHQMRTPLYVTIYDADGNAVSNTLKYSIETYATNKKDSTVPGLADMIVAMMKYGDSTAAYHSIINN